MTGTRDFARGRVGATSPARRALGLATDGLWGMIVRDDPSGIYYHSGALGWSAGASFRGRGFLVGWMRKGVNIGVIEVEVEDEEDDA